MNPLLSRGFTYLHRRNLGLTAGGYMIVRRLAHGW
jgi:hypothetical protein